jgi:hypothetical protein
VEALRVAALAFAGMVGVGGLVLLVMALAERYRRLRKM